MLKNILFAPGLGEKYSDERVCMFVSPSVHLSASIGISQQELSWRREKASCFC